MEALLHVNHLEKNLDEFVLKDVNLTLQPGYIMGLIGVNGTGKTTLIQTILNLYKKDAGDVYVNALLNGGTRAGSEGSVSDLCLIKMCLRYSLSVWKNAKLFGKLDSRFDEEVFRRMLRAISGAAESEGWKAVDRISGAVSACICTF